MSLLDALLLEPPKLEVWIALRTDGVLGSGTQADPFDGSAIKTAPLTISSLSVVSGTGFVAEATLVNHGLAKNDIIIVSRATNPADGDWWVPASDRFRYALLSLDTSPWLRQECPT